jgi:hypothetical protein
MHKMCHCEYATYSAQARNRRARIAHYDDFESAEFAQHPNCRGGKRGRSKLSDRFPPSDPGVGHLRRLTVAKHPYHGANVKRATLSEDEEGQPMEK